MNLKIMIGNYDLRVAWGIIIASFLIKVCYIFNLTHYSQSLYADMGTYWNSSFERLAGNTHSITQYAVFPTCYIFILAEFLRLIKLIGLISHALNIAIIVNILLYALSGYTFYQIASKLIKRKSIALTALIFYSISYTATYLNALILPENLAIPLLVIITSILLLKPLNLKNILLIGFSLGIIGCTKPVFLFISFAFILYVYFETIKKGFLKFFIFLLALAFVPIWVVSENYKISDTKLVGLGAYGGANFFAGWTQAGKVESSSEDGFWWMCGTPFLDGSNTKTFSTNIPFRNQTYYYNLGIQTILKDPTVLYRKLTWFKNLFFGIFIPAHSTQPWGYDDLMMITQIILLTMTIFIGFCIYFARKSHDERKILNFFILSIFFLILGLYIMGYPERRYFYSMEFIIILLSFVCFDWLLSAKNFFIKLQASNFNIQLTKTKKFLPFVFLFLIVAYIYQPSYLDYARRDHIIFISERNNYKNDTDWFKNAINYNRTRHSAPGDYYLFRPAFHAFLSTYDIFFRKNLLLSGITSICLHLAVVFLIFYILKTHFNTFIALPISGIFASQSLGIEMVTWRHISFYMFSVIFLLLSFLMLKSQTRFKYPLFGLFLFLGMLFHEIIPCSIIVMLIILSVFLYSSIVLLHKKIFIPKKFLITSLISILLFLLFDWLSWMITHPPSLLGPADHLTMNLGFVTSSLINLIQYLGLGIKTFFYPFLMNLSWDKSTSDWAYFSLKISSDHFLKYIPWSIAAVILIFSTTVITLRRILTSNHSISDLIALWSCCALSALTLMYSFMRLSLRDTGYGSFSTYYYWFISLFYVFIVSYLLNLILNKISTEHYKRVLIVFIYIISSVFILTQAPKARNSIQKNYDLPWAKQITQAIVTADLYFKLNPDQCLDPSEKNLGVPPRHLQYFTLPYYLHKYNCGVGKGTSIAHLVRTKQGVTVIQPGPYPNKDQYKPL